MTDSTLYVRIYANGTTKTYPFDDTTELEEQLAYDYKFRPGTWGVTIDPSKNVVTVRQGYDSPRVTAEIDRIQREADAYRAVQTDPTTASELTRGD